MGMHTGILQVADFGLATFHRNDSKDERRQAHRVPTYEPPENQHSEITSQKYDIWSLGCLFLEFATWLVSGFHAVQEEFSTLRIGAHICAPGEDPRFALDDFYVHGANPPELKYVVRQVCSLLFSFTSKSRLQVAILTDFVPTSGYADYDIPHLRLMQFMTYLTLLNQTCWSQIRTTEAQSVPLRTSCSP